MVFVKRALGVAKLMLLAAPGSALVLFLTLSGCQGIANGPNQIPLPPPNPNATLQNSVNHIIFMMQENRSFDAYFGKLNDFRAGVFGLGRDTDDLETTFTNQADDGTMVSNFHLSTGCIFNTTAAWLESWGDMNRFGGASSPLLLDGFVHTAGLHAITDGDPDSRGVRAMGFYDGSDLARPYWLATQFATSDRFYAPAPVQTEVVRLWAMAATSQGFIHPPAETNGSLSSTTIFQLLDAAKVSWKIYSVDTGGDGKLITSLRNFQPYGLNQESKIVPIAQLFTDMQNGTLPQFAYIEPAFISGNDEHPGGGTNIWTGAQFIGHIIETLMNSPSWKDSIFIETFDEGGGLFDHVGPMIDGQPIQELSMGAAGQAIAAGVHSKDANTQRVPSPDGLRPRDLHPDDADGDFTRTGFRVPLIVVSPFAKANYVSHTPMDYTAVLKFVEKRFGLPHLNQRDAAQPDMTEFFDFINAPNTFAPTPPAQPTNLSCTPMAAAGP
jgi:phospholipase C